ncbi:MAG TPA: hypothetical protein VG738_19900 [Chitinophagaceae bacterium]|nr:hypothetical protein [Chitinophagaceae bacterium]
MNKLITFFCVCLAFLTGCGASAKLTNQGDVTITNHGYITVVGMATEDIKGGPLIEGDSTHRYFIKGLHEWSKYAYGKKIRAHGKYITIDKRKLMDKEPWIQGYRIKDILENVKWEVID